MPTLFDKRICPSGGMQTRWIQAPVPRSGRPSSNLGTGTDDSATSVAGSAVLASSGSMPPYRADHPVQSQWRRWSKDLRKGSTPVPRIDHPGIRGGPRVIADEALMAGHLISNQWVAGSIPVIRSQSQGCALPAANALRGGSSASGHPSSLARSPSAADASAPMM